MCPRYASSHKFGAKSEVYSFGVVLLELITGCVQNKPNDLYIVYIEDEERDLVGDADPRAGVWPDVVITELVALAASCLDSFKHRLVSVAPAMQQLTALARLHCCPTAEEVQLIAMREEVARLKLQLHVEDTQRNEPAVAELTVEDVTCMVCFDEFSPGHGLSCDEGHFLCGHVHGGDCLGGHIHGRVETLGQTDRLAAQIETAEAAGNTRRQHELGGAIHCPVPGCSALAFTDAHIFRHASEATVAEYLGAKILLPVAREAARTFETAQAAVHAAQAEAAGRVSAGMAREAAHRLLEQQMQKELPTARQCGQCGVGPVLHAACWDLEAHQGERHGAARINNGCPRCGWFSRDINDWPTWNGKMPRDAPDEGTLEPTRESESEMQAAAQAAAAQAAAQVGAQAAVAQAAAARAAAAQAAAQAAAAQAAAKAAPQGLKDVEDATTFETLVAAMRVHTGNEHVQEHACRAMGDRIDSLEDRAQAERTGAVEALVEAMRGHTENENLQKWACGAIANICQYHMNTDRAGRAGAVEAVVAAMRGHTGNEDLQEHACAAIARICQSAEGLDRAGRAGAVEAVVVAMRGHTGNEDLQKCACLAISRICQSAEWPDRAGRAGAVEALVVAMRGYTGNDYLQWFALTALCFLTPLNNTDNTTRAVRAGAKNLAEAAILAHPCNVQVIEAARDLLIRLGQVQINNTKRNLAK
jgi:hypothetical protein